MTVPVSGDDTEAASAALGIGSTGQESGAGSQSNDNEGQAEGDTEGESSTETTFEQLPESWQKEIQKLRREAAAKRVATKPAAQKKPATPSGETGTSLTQADLDAVREEERAASRQEYGEQLASARIEAALAGIVENPSEIIEDLNLARYVREDGTVDTEAVSLLKTRYSKFASKKPTVNVGHGRSGNTQTSKGTPADQFAEAMKDFI